MALTRRQGDLEPHGLLVSQFMARICELLLVDAYILMALQTAVTLSIDLARLDARKQPVVKD